MNSFKRLLGYAKPFGRFWPVYLILSLLSVLFGIVNYALIDPLLTLLFTPETIDTTVARPEFSLTSGYATDMFKYYLARFMSESGMLKGLLFVCIILVFASFLSNLMRFLSQKMLVDLRTRTMRNIREDLFSKILKLHVGYFNNSRKGEILSSISNDVTEVQNSVASGFHILLKDPILAIGFLVMLFVTSPKLTLLTLVTLPVSAIVIGRISRSLKRGAKDTQSLMGMIMSNFEEAISGVRIIKAFNAQSYVKGNFDALNNQHREASRRMFTRQEIASPLSEFLGISVAVSVLFYGGWLQLRGELGMTLPEFVVYIAYYWRVLEPSKAISSAYASIQRGLVSADRLYAILDVEEEMKEKENALPVKSFTDCIEFQNVSFSYASEPVLKNISFKIPKGKMIALVGPSGAGKSTIADLLPRFYDINEGSIKLDGTDIRDYRKNDLTSLMGIVTQEAILFNDTVYNNITFGMNNVSEEDVVNAAKIANAHEFIVNMEEGYNTNIGDRGAKLSGGQRQRLAIARAVLKNPPILILDEATSALDTESERLVQDALTKLMKNRTSLVIAHRLSTIQHADEIVVIQAGRIVERGTHDSLMSLGGVYSYLCHLQAFNK